MEEVLFWDIRERESSHLLGLCKVENIINKNINFYCEYCFIVDYSYPFCALGTARSRQQIWLPLEPSILAFTKAPAGMPSGDDGRYNLLFPAIDIRKNLLSCAHARPNISCSD